MINHITKNPKHSYFMLTGRNDGIYMRCNFINKGKYKKIYKNDRYFIEKYNNIISLVFYSSMSNKYIFVGQIVNHGDCSISVYDYVAAYNYKGGIQLPYKRYTSFKDAKQKLLNMISYEREKEMKFALNYGFLL